MKKAVIALAGLAVVALVVTGAGSSAPTSQLSKVSHIVVIYEETTASTTCTAGGRA
jgi:hypothetical protein